METFESVYVKSFDEVLGLVQRSFAHLFEEQALRTLSRLRGRYEDASPSPLIGDVERSLLARMILRRASWMRSSSLTRYSPSGSLEESIKGIHGLQTALMLQVIDRRSPFEWVWEAITSAFTVADLKLLGRLMGNIKCSGSKDDVLLKLNSVFTTQKDISGKLASSRAADLFLEVVEQNYGKKELFVSISPETLTTIRRFYRIANVGNR